MGRILGALLVLLVLTVLAAGLYIAMGDIPPPAETIEKTIPAERFEQ